MAWLTSLTTPNRITQRYKAELIQQVGTLQSLSPVVIAPTGSNVYEIRLATYNYEYPGIDSSAAAGLINALLASDANSMDAWAEYTGAGGYSVFHTIQTKTYVRQIS